MGMYLVLWESLKFTLNCIYTLLRYASGVYPPAKQFLKTCEKIAAEFHTQPVITAGRNTRTLLHELWTPSTVLEGLGLISVAAPVSVAVFGSTAVLMCACSVLTTVLFASVTLWLPFGLCCGIGYIMGTIAHKVGHSMASLARSVQMYGGMKHASNLKSKQGGPAAGSKSSTNLDASDSESPKISSDVSHTVLSPDDSVKLVA